MEDYLIEAKKKKEHLNPASRTRYLVQECCFFPPYQEACRLPDQQVLCVILRLCLFFFFYNVSVSKILLVISAKQPTSG